MPFNGSGVFQRLRNWVADAAANIKIRADYHDAEDDGFAAGLTNCITKDGQTLVTQNIPFNSKRITGLQDPINAQDASTKAYADTKLSFGTGGTLTGDLSIRKANPVFALDAVSGGWINSIYGMVNDKNRWLIRLGNGDTESGSNAGSNFSLHSFADDGNVLAQVLNFNRATGAGTVAVIPTDPYGIVNKSYADYYDNLRLQLSGGTMTGTLVSNTTTRAIGVPSSIDTVEVRGTGHAGMTFHIPSVFAANFGLAPDGHFYMGGGTYGDGVYHKFWTDRDFPTPPTNGVINAQWAYAGDLAASTGPQSTTYEPYPGAAITGWQWAIVGYATVTSFRLRRLQIYTTSWFTIGYV